MSLLLSTAPHDAPDVAGPGDVPVVVRGGVPPVLPRVGRRRGAASRRRVSQVQGAGCVVGVRPGRALADIRPALSSSARTPILRLTQRGVLVLAALTAMAAVALVWLAWLSAPADTPPAAAPAQVTVQSGDTLWSIASTVAPQRDPRQEVALLQQLNHLEGAQLAVGQVLRTH